MGAGLALGAMALGASPPPTYAEAPPDDAELRVPAGGEPAVENPAPAPAEDTSSEDLLPAEPPEEQAAPPAATAPAEPPAPEEPAPPSEPGHAPPPAQASPRPRPRRHAPARHPALRGRKAAPAGRRPALQAPGAQVVPIEPRPAPGPSRPPRTSAQGGSYLVQAGDTLWSIAVARLGPGATRAQIAREVERIWSLNRDRIASGDPDLIRVGERLRLA